MTDEKQAPKPWACDECQGTGRWLVGAKQVGTDGNVDKGSRSCPCCYGTGIDPRKPLVKAALKACDGMDDPVAEIERLRTLFSVTKIAALRQTVAAHEPLIAAAEKFVNKCETGRARSVTTYAEMKAALAAVAKAKELLNG
jgi:hypothetical protein